MAETQVSKPKVTLHWLDLSRSQRVVWLLNECKGLDYKIDVYKRVNMLAPPELKKVHPLGKVSRCSQFTIEAKAHCFSLL